MAYLAMLFRYFMRTLLLIALLFYFNFNASAQDAVVKSQQSVQLTSSDLPIVVIDSHGATIKDNPKISASLKIYNNGPGKRNYLTDTPQFTGNSGIEIRGSSSQSFPKKSYGLETWDALGNSIDTSFLGMPSESDWILNANYSDKTLIRNVITYQIWRNMGHYSTRYQFVELIINSEYQGVYIFSEKIKRDKNRLDIAKLTNLQNTGDELTGGYIFKIDKQTGSGGSGWNSSYSPPANPTRQIFFQYEYPKDVDITSQQKIYLQSNVYNFETALKADNFADTLNGFRKYASEKTFIDYFLVNEMSKNVDGYRLSTYMNKERDSKDGRIRMGPVWDYDIAWHNANYCEGDLSTGWAYQFPCTDDYWQVPFWWGRLLEDPRYKNNLACRWLSFRQNILSNAWFDTYIDSISNQLFEAQQRNFIQWPIIGSYVWPNPWPYPATYQGEVEVLKTWIHDRLSWLDAQFPNTCDKTYSINENELAGTFVISPNPATDYMHIGFAVSDKALVHFEIYNQQGIMLFASNTSSRSPGEYNEIIDVTAYKPGVYLLRLSIDGKIHTQRFIKI